MLPPLPVWSTGGSERPAAGGGGLRGRGRLPNAGGAVAPQLEGERCEGSRGECDACAEGQHADVGVGDPRLSNWGRRVDGLGPGPHQPSPSEKRRKGGLPPWCVEKGEAVNTGL